MRKLLYIAGMVLLTILLVLGSYQIGLTLRAAGFDGSLFYGVTGLLLVGVVTLSWLKTFRRGKRPESVPSLRRLLVLLPLYHGILFLLLIATTLFCGASGGSLHVGYLLFAGYHVYAYLSAFFMTFDALPDGEEADEEAYPTLYRVAKQAVERVGLDKEPKVHLYFRANLFITAIRLEGEFRIHIGTQLPALLNEYELEALLTAELGLMKESSPTVDLALRQRVIHWQTAAKNDAMPYVNALVSASVIPLTVAAEAYYRACLPEDEKRRLRTAGTFAVPSDYVSAYAKVMAYELSLFSTSHHNPYAGATPPQTFQEDLIAEYERFLEREMPRFSDAVLRHRPFPEAMTLEERMSALNVKAFSLHRDDISLSYTEEAGRILKIGNEDFAFHFEENYEKQREEHYLCHKATADAYEHRIASGGTPSEEETVEAATAFRSLGQPERAEALFDSILASQPRHALACEGKGFFLLERFDDRGIALLEIAMAENEFCHERILRLFEAYYRRIGENEMADKTVQRLEDFLKAEQARQRAFRQLNGPEAFTAPPLSEELCGSISCEIRRILGRTFLSVYLVGCRAPELEGITYLLVQPDPDASRDEIETAMRKLFLYLDNREELFFLIRTEDKPTFLSFADRIEGLITVSPKDEPE